jgi:hypothetical protein
MIWASHTEENNNNAPPHPLNLIDAIMHNSDFGAIFDDANSSGKGSGNDWSRLPWCYGVNDIGVDDGGDGGDDNDGYDRSQDDELDDSDYLTQLLCNTKEEILVGSAKGLEKFKIVKKEAEENVYPHSKGCPKHWTMLHFILEMLNLKAKHDWFDGSFNDLLRILAWLLPKQNKVPTNTHRAKKLGNPFRMGVERIHACPTHRILDRGDTFKHLEKCHVCSANQYKKNTRSCVDD